MTRLYKPTGQRGSGVTVFSFLHEREVIRRVEGELEVGDGTMTIGVVRCFQRKRFISTRQCTDNGLDYSEK